MVITNCSIKKSYKIGALRVCDDSAVRVEFELGSVVADFVRQVSRFKTFLNRHRRRRKIS
jgi:hypothetical protein